MATPPPPALSSTPVLSLLDSPASVPSGIHRIFPPFPGPPFTCNSSADLIIKSSDNVRFYVVKAIMTAASSIFADMLVVAQPDSQELSREGDEKLPVVEVSERSRVVDRLLRFCYPVRAPPINDRGDVLQMLEVSRKYAIDIIQDACADYLLKYAAKDPMAAYLITCKYGLGQVAEVAAQKTLNCSLDTVLTCNRPETQMVSFACVQRLCAFRKDCQSAMITILDGRTCAVMSSVKQLFPTPTTPAKPVLSPHRAPNDSLIVHPATSCIESALLKRSCCVETTFQWSPTGGTNVDSKESVTVKGWWLDYLRSLKTSVRNVHTTGRQRAAEEDAFYSAMKVAISCNGCQNDNLKYFKNFEADLQQWLDAQISMVASKHSFVD